MVFVLERNVNEVLRIVMQSQRITKKFEFLKAEILDLVWKKMI